MKLLVQRVSEACVTVNEEEINKISKGLLVFIGMTHSDTKAEADFLVKKLINLRIFRDEQEKMNLSVKDINGEILLISQFTLYANCNDGNRPNFIDAAKPEYAKELYEYFCKECNKAGIPTKLGIFGAHMEIKLLNDGPVTIFLEK